VQASPSCRLPSPSPKSARVLQVAVTEQPTSPDTHAPAAARHTLSRPPPVAARLRTADVHSHRHVAMAALRFSLLVAVLLGLVLLTAPDQASAEATVLYLCMKDKQLCAHRRLRCSECSDHCTKASKTDDPWVADKTTFWARWCSEASH